MPVIRAKEPAPIDGWEAAVVFESSAAPVDDRDRSPTPAEEDLFPDDPIEDPEAEQEEEARAENITDPARDGSPMPVENTIGETAPAADEAMDTSADMADTSAEEKASTSTPKPKKKNSELSQLLNMDFGPKEGGRAEQILNYGTRVRKTITPVSLPPSRKVLPKRNAERKKDEEAEKDEEKDHGEGTSDTPTGRSSRRKRGGAQEAEKATPAKTRRDVSKDAEAQAASEAEKKAETSQAAPAANAEGPPVLTPVEGTSPEPPADPTSAATVSKQNPNEPVRVANLFHVGDTAQPAQPVAQQSTPPATTPKAIATPAVVTRVGQNMDLADRLRHQKQQQELMQQKIKQESQQLAERQRIGEQQRQRQQEEFARTFVHSPQEVALRQQAMERAKVEEAAAARLEFQRRRDQERLERDIHREREQREQREPTQREKEQDIMQRIIMDRNPQQRPRAPIQPNPGFSNQLPAQFRPHQPSPPSQLQQQYHQHQQQQLLQMQQQQQQNQHQRRRPAMQNRVSILNRPGIPQQQPPQPQQYRQTVHAQVVVAPPGMPQIPQIPVTVRPANMLEPERPVLNLLPGENDCLEHVPMPNGKINYNSWDTNEYAEWAKQCLSGAPGEEVAAVIIKEGQSGFDMADIVGNLDDVVKTYSVSLSTARKFKAFAISTINRTKRHLHATKMKEYEEQMRIYNLPH